MPELTWTQWLAIAAFLVSIAAACFALAAAVYAARNSAASVGVRKLAWIEAELLETRDLIDGLSHSLKKLRSRMYVRKRRDEAEGDVLPTDRDALKAALRKQVGLTKGNASAN